MNAGNKTVDLWNSSKDWTYALSNLSSFKWHLELIFKTSLWYLIISLKAHTHTYIHKYIMLAHSHTDIWICNFIKYLCYFHVNLSTVILAYPNKYLWRAKKKIISLLSSVLVVPLVNKKELYLLFLLCKMSWCLQSACHHTCHTCQLSLWMHVELWAQCLTPDNYSVNGNYLYTKLGICITRNKENMGSDGGIC